MNEENLLVDRQEMYRLFEYEGGLGLGVLCGGVGMYEVKIRLTEAEEARYREEGRDFLADLSKLVRHKKEEFRDRWITE